MPLMININKHKGNQTLVENIVENVVEKATVVADGENTSIKEISKTWKIINVIGCVVIVIYNGISLIYTIINLINS
jgi:hypothetical protein